MKIYFARHGESQANILHLISTRKLAHSLTTAGQAQAVALAKRLQKLPITKIFSSPLLRATQTANILVDNLSVPCEQVDGLGEFDCGVAEGRSDAEAWQLWQSEINAWVFDHHYEFQIAGGESFYQVRDRFEGFLQRLMMDYGGTASHIVCISHGGIYRVMLPLIMANITPEMVIKRGFEYSSYVVAEEQSAGLVCIEWNGMPIQ